MSTHSPNPTLPSASAPDKTANDAQSDICIGSVNSTSLDVGRSSPSSTASDSNVKQDFHASYNLHKNDDQASCIAGTCLWDTNTDTPYCIGGQAAAIALPRMKLNDDFCEKLVEDLKMPENWESRYDSLMMSCENRLNNIAGKSDKQSSIHIVQIYNEGIQEIRELSEEIAHSPDWEMAERNLVDACLSLTSESFAALRQVEELGILYAKVKSGNSGADLTAVTAKSAVAPEDEDDWFLVDKEDTPVKE